MGQIVIDTPLDNSFNFLIQDANVAEAVIDKLYDVALHLKDEKVKEPIIEPAKTSRKEALEAAFGLWADRPETGEEISRKIREANRKIT